MKTEFITSEKLYYAFIAGAQATIKKRDELNKLNVFPVADNDTGSNLSFTMQSIMEETVIGDSPKKTLESISDAALNGARGNSGIIFAQFLNGLHHGLLEDKEISVPDFSKAVNYGVRHAYESISNPVEGTIITVMQDWSQSLNLLKERTTDFAQLFIISLEAAVQSVNTTTDKLKVLKEASVVDAGGKGFAYFLEGMTSYFMSPEQDVSVYIASDIEEYVLQEDHVLHVDENEIITHRYCTEVLLKSNQMDLELLKDALQDYGDSLIVAGKPERARIHIHTNQPDAVVEKMRCFGDIVQQKVDDMQRQFESVHARKYKIALVTDSIADLPKEIMDAYQIHMIPLNIIIGESSYLDKVTINPSYLYETMDYDKDYPTSSQPTVKNTEKFLNSIVSHYDSVIVITVSQKMSGTYETIVRAANNIDQTGEKITVVNSKLNSGAQGLVVLKAVEEIAKEATHKEVVKVIHDTIERTKIFVSVDTLKYMVRSGRIKKHTGFAAKILNLKPVVSIDEDGDGIIIGKALSVKANIKKMQELVKEIAETKQITTYSIIHANAEERANEFKKIYTNLIGKEPEYITEISSIISMNAGIGCVAIALTTD